MVPHLNLTWHEALSAEQLDALNNSREQMLPKD
jgi:hypothetical protein